MVITQEVVFQVGSYIYMYMEFAYVTPILLFILAILYEDTLFTCLEQIC